MNTFAERNLALAAAEDGELREAEEALDRLVARLEEAGDPLDGRVAAELSLVLRDRANVRAWAVRPADALADITRAQALAEGLKAVNRHALRVALLNLKAALLAAPHSPVHDAAAADAALAAMRDELVAPGESWMGDAVELRFAQYRRDWERVASLAPALVGRLTELGQARGVHAVRLQLARALLQLGRAGAARAHAESAHAFFAREGPPDIAAQGALALARSLGPPARWELVEEALGVVERLVRAQRSLFDQQRYLVEKMQMYDDALRLALGDVVVDAAPHDRERAILRAWEVAERAKSFSLRHAMTQGGWLQAIDPESAAALRALDERIDALEAQSERSDESFTLQSELTAQRQDVLQDAMRRSPLVAQVASPPRLDMAALLGSLEEGIGVVSWHWLESAEGWQLHVFHAGADRTARHACVPWSREERSALVTAQRRSTTSFPAFVRQLLPPNIGDALYPAAVLEALDSCHTILATPHGELRKIPLHAAQVTRGADGGGVGDAWLLERHALQVLPTLALPFPQPLDGQSREELLLLGCGEDGFGHPVLTDVEPELREIADAWGAKGHAVRVHAMCPGDRLDGHVPLSEWSQYDIIHLACHGAFMAESPLDATLFLGSDSLRATDFFGVRLRARLVCLSACDVGQHSDQVDGLSLAGDEWLGLALPLFQSGTRTLLTSLWEAQSEVAREFMKALHEGLAEGLSPARAHQRACLRQIEERCPFGFWANWQLAGFPT